MEVELAPAPMLQMVRICVRSPVRTKSCSPLSSRPLTLPHCYLQYLTPFAVPVAQRLAGELHELRVKHQKATASKTLQVVRAALADKMMLKKIVAALAVSKKVIRCSRTAR